MPDGLDIARLCALMQQTGTLQQVQDILAREHISTLYCAERQKLAQAVLQGGAEDAPEKLAWLLTKGSLPKALSYWEAAWRPYMDAASMPPETQAAAFKQLQLLDQLLSADADLPSPQQLTPADPELKARYLDILKNHHIDPTDEETPSNRSHFTPARASGACVPLGPKRLDMARALLPRKLVPRAVRRSAGAGEHDTRAA